MKKSDCIKCIFLPSKHNKTVSLNYAFAAKILCIAYIIFFVSTVFAIRQFTADTFDQAAEIITDTNDFYMENAKFHYEGGYFEKKIENIGLDIIVSPDISALNKANGFSAIVGTDSAVIVFGDINYELIYNTFDSNISNIEFTKDTVISYLSTGRSIAINTITSTLIFIGMLLAVILMGIILFATLITSLFCKILNAKLDFGIKFFITISSFVYPMLISALIMIIPGGLRFLFGNFLVLFGAFVLMTILYIITAIYKANKSAEPEKEVFNEFLEHE